jgi:mRNA interferase HigB
VRPISKSRVAAFWESRKEDSLIAERDLSAWLKLIKHAEWDNFGEFKQTFGSADQVGNCVVFDVGNNRYRLIGRVNYGAGIIYVLKVMDHAEYDKKRWIDDCDCHKPPPRPTAKRKASAKGKASKAGHRPRGMKKGR